MALVAKARMAGMFLAWSALAGVIVAAFFISSFFADFAPLQLGDPGVVILFLPLFTAFILGLLLVDYELVQTVIAALLATGIAVGLVMGFMFAPLLGGVAVEGALFQQFILQRVALSAVLLFPLVLLGTVVGRAVGERILPPEEVRKRQKALMDETREWHDRLTGTGSKPPAPEDEKRA